jgi:hypothetical protein
MTDFNLSIFVSSILSSLIVGGVAFYFFKTHVEHLQQKSRLELKLRFQKETLPIRLQAYERLTLLVERLSLVNLLKRIKPVGNDKQAYEDLLIGTIEQEFEHNLVQQIYVSGECWNIIKTAKNSTISRIRKTNMSDNIKDAQKLRETLMRDLLDQGNSPNDIALQVIKKELKALF